MALQVGQLAGSTAAGVRGSTATFNLRSGAPLWLSAPAGNTSDVFLGGSTTVSSTDGFALSPGDGVRLTVQSLGDIYLRLITAGDVVSWTLD